VLAEASGASYDYSQDRGISVAFSGSRERLAGALTNELLERLHGRANVQTHFLGLPLAFRTRGGFGTHWMYAKEFQLSDPRVRAGASGTLTLDRAELEALWVALHNPNQFFCDSPQQPPDPAKADILQRKNPRQVREWICGGKPGETPDLHVDNWKELVTRLRQYPPR
jgi:hypothetical protein